MSNAEKKTKRRKKKWLKIAVPMVIVMVAAAFTVLPKGKDTSTPVYTQTVSKGDIDTKLNVSGKVAAEEKVTFFAPANAKVEEIRAAKGDVVKAGDMLLRFDKSAVEYARQQSAIQERISSSDYTTNAKYNDDQKAKLAQAEVEIIEAEADIDNYEKYIKSLEDGIKDETAKKRSDLYAKINSAQKALGEYDLAIQIPTGDTDMEALMRKKTDKQNELNKLNNELSLLSDYETKQGWEDLLAQAKRDLEDSRTRLSEAKSKKSSAEAALENEGKLAGYRLNREKSNLENADAEKKYQATLDGVVAGFNGVISALDVVEGATVQEGTKLMVIESFDSVCVEFQASKYALETLALGQKAGITISGREYAGTVSKINHVAEADTNGTPMVAARVHIDNPDENIFLGIDAKLQILTASEKDILQVPVEAVNLDSKGEFCYVIENGVLAKKYVSTGISSDEYIQIKDGLAQGQEIVTTPAGGAALEEGTAVTPMPSETAVSEMTESSEAEGTGTSSEQEQTEAGTDNG